MMDGCKSWFNGRLTADPKHNNVFQGHFNSNFEFFFFFGQTKFDKQVIGYYLGLEITQSHYNKHGLVLKKY
jgi:hypothetical protein